MSARNITQTKRLAVKERRGSSSNNNNNSSNGNSEKKESVISNQCCRWCCIWKRRTKTLEWREQNKNQNQKHSDKRTESKLQSHGRKFTRDPIYERIRGIEMIFVLFSKGNFIDSNCWIKHFTINSVVQVFRKEKKFRLRNTHKKWTTQIYETHSLFTNFFVFFLVFKWVSFICWTNDFTRAKEECCDYQRDKMIFVEYVCFEWDEQQQKQ